MDTFQNDVLQVINTRSSLRSFSDQPVSKETEQAIIQAALRAPTATNRMLYSILLIRDQETKDLLAERCNHQAFIRKAPLVMVFLLDQQRLYDFYAYNGVPELCRRKGKKFMVPAEHHFLLGAHDAINAAQNAVIAAESLGLGSCYIGHIVSHYEKNRELFDLPPYVFPITMLVMGYTAEGITRRKSSRFDQKYIVFENKYHRLTPEESKDMYRSIPFSEDDRLGAANNAQLYYMNRYAKDECYFESVRSVKEALKFWTGEEFHG